MFVSYSHHNLSTFLPNVSRTPAIFSVSVSCDSTMFVSTAADVLEPLRLEEIPDDGDAHPGRQTISAGLDKSA